jgi:hypothetical protein
MKVPGRLMVAVYFDNSVIRPVADAAAGPRLRELLDQQGGQAHASIQNLLEAWRNNDAASRARFIETLLTVASSHEEEPLLLTAGGRLVDEIRAHHPDWLVAAPDLSSQAEHRKVRAEIWSRMATKPTDKPMNMLRREQFLYEAIAASNQRQRVIRRARQGGIALPSPVVNIDVAVHLQPLVDGLSEADAFWRQSAAAAWWRGAIQGDDNLTDLRDYLRPYLAVDLIAAEPWMRFWLAEADAAALPVIRAEFLAQFFQPDHRITPGNWGDINHAGSAVGRDFILTADHDFFDVLAAIHQQSDMAIAEPRFIRRDAPDVVAEIRSKLGW